MSEGLLKASCGLTTGLEIKEDQGRQKRRGIQVLCWRSPQMRQRAPATSRGLLHTRVRQAQERIGSEALVTGGVHEAADSPTHYSSVSVHPRPSSHSASLPSSCIHRSVPPPTHRPLSMEAHSDPGTVLDAGGTEPNVSHLPDESMWSRREIQSLGDSIAKCKGLQWGLLQHGDGAGSPPPSRPAALDGKGGPASRLSMCHTTPIHWKAEDSEPPRKLGWIHSPTV